MNAKKIFSYTFVLTLILLFLISCQSAQGFPEGSYTAVLSAENLPADLPPEVVTFLAGTWEITFTNDALVANKDGELMVEGTYYANNDKITVTDTGGPASATSAEEATGQYQWTLKGDQLTFSVLNEPSFGRQIVFATVPWTKK